MAAKENFRRFFALLRDHAFNIAIGGPTLFLIACVYLILDGKSFLSVLRGKVSIHKHFTYGMMTTRGILNGSDAYAVRTVRGARYRLIWNLNYETRFTNACTQSGHFRSMVAAAKAGDASGQARLH